MVALTGGRTACIREWRCSTSVGHVWRTCGIATRRGRSRRAIGTFCFHTTNTCLGGTSRVFVSPFGTEFIMGQNNRRTKQSNNQTTKQPNNQTTKQSNNQTLTCTKYFIRQLNFPFPSLTPSWTSVSCNC